MEHSSVLIVGGTGQISTALTCLLAGQGYEVTIYNRGQRHVELPAAVRTIVGDRQDRDTFKRVLGAGHYDVVFDFICWSAEDAASDVATFQDHCDQFVYISTAWVYGPASIFPTPETHPCRPVEGYGRSKLAAEEVFRAAHRARHFPVTIVRLHATYDDRADLGGILAGDNTTIFRMKQDKPILVHDRGTHLTQFLHAEDAARALQGLVEHPEQSIGQAYNVAGEPVTWRDYFVRLGRTLGLQPRFASTPAEVLIQWAKPHDWPLMGMHQFNVMLDTTKLFRAVPALAWQVSLEDGFRRRLAHRQMARADDVEHDPDPAMTERIDGIVARWQQVLRQTNLGETGEGPDPGWERWMGNGSTQMR